MNRVLVVQPCIFRHISDVFHHFAEPIAAIVNVNEIGTEEECRPIFTFQAQFSCCHSERLPYFFPKRVPYMYRQKPVKDRHHFLCRDFIQILHCDLASGGPFSVLRPAQQREQRCDKDFPLFCRAGFQPLMERMIQHLCFF